MYKILWVPSVFSALTLLVGHQNGHLACKKTEWWDAGVVIFLGRGADLHMAELMPLPLTVSCFTRVVPDSTHTHMQLFCGSLDFVRDNPGEPVPEETFTCSHLSSSSVIPYLLPPSITIHSILPVQFTCLTVFFHSLSKISLVYQRAVKWMLLYKILPLS